MSRLDQVNSSVLRIIANACEELQTGDVDLFTITRVSVSPDLRSAEVWFEGIGNDTNNSQVKSFLEKNRTVLQKIINKQNMFKFTPVLTFKLDESAGYSNKIGELLRDEN